MADYLTNTTELTAVADAIREKTGESGNLIFPNGFVNAIENIETGGGNSQLYIFVIDAPYHNTSVSDGSMYGGVDPLTSYSVIAGTTYTIKTVGDHILDTITGLTTSSNIPYTTVQRGTYTFTMPNESVYCELYYDD